MTIEELLRSKTQDYTLDETWIAVAFDLMRSFSNEEIVYFLRMILMECSLRLVAHETEGSRLISYELASHGIDRVIELVKESAEENE